MDRTLQTAKQQQRSEFLLAASKLEQPDLLHGAAQALHHLKQDKKTNPKHQVERDTLITFTLTTQLLPSHMQLDLFLLFMLQLLLTKEIILRRAEELFQL